MGTVDDLIRDLSRSFELLSDAGSSKFQKKKSLEAIWTKTNEHLSGLSEESKQEQANEFFLYSSKHLAGRFSDPAEQIREKSIDMVTCFMQNSDKVPNTVCIAILNCLVARVGQKEVLEPSEELRLKLALLLDLMVQKLQKDAHLYLAEMTQVFAQLLGDAFHEIKKQVCCTVSHLAQLTEGYFHSHAEKYVKPLLHSISHQHSRVRKEVVRCIGQVIQYGPGKLVDEVISHLAQRLFDDSPVVREEVINVIGMWLLDLPDRYSFFHKFIPLLLTGISDEIPSISEKALAYWDDIGAKFEQENEEELKDKMDFAAPPPSHRPESLGPRPNLGCRTLIFRNLSKILPPLTRDLGDWVVETRVKSAELLPVLLVNAEECATQHLEILLSASYRACADEEVRVRDGVLRGVRCLAHFVEPRLWWRLLRPAMRRADGHLRCVLTVLTQLLAGAERQSLLPLLPEVANALAEPEVSHSLAGDVKEAFAKCVGGVLEACDEETANTVADQMYFCLLSAMTSPGGKDEAEGLRRVTEQCRELMTVLADRLQLADPACRTALHRRLFPACLARLQESRQNWTKYSYERAVLDTLCLESGPVVGANLDALMEIFRVCLDVEKDVELRLRLFLLLGRLCQRQEETLDSCGALGGHFSPLLLELILPNCRWRAGRTAEAIRKVATSCLWALLEPLGSSSEAAERLRPTAQQLLTSLGSLMDDECQETRLLACRCLESLLSGCPDGVDSRALHDFYPQLLKRLDDTCDCVRLRACSAFERWLNALANDFSPDLYAAHLEDIYRGLLVHMDDQEEAIRAAVLKVLTVAGRLHPAKLKEEIDRVRHKHRDPARLDGLLGAVRDAGQ